MGLFTKKKAKPASQTKPSVPSGSASQHAAPAAPKTPSTQSWLPIKDIRNSLVYRKDDTLLAAVRVQPVNINLLSNKERMRKVKRLEEVLNGIDYLFQIVSIAKPVDLDAYIQKLELLRHNTSSVLKKRLLGIYSKQAAAKATSGEALERHFYVLIDRPIGKKLQLDEQVILQRATQLASSFSSAELYSSVCTDAELRTLNFIFTNPAHASFERAPADNIMLPPVFYSSAAEFSEEVHSTDE